MSPHGSGAIPPDLGQGRRRRWLLLLLAVLLITGIGGQSYYSQPTLGIGSRAPETVVIRERRTIVDPIATERQREQARLGVAPVLEQDSFELVRTRQRLGTLLEQLERHRRAQVADPDLNPLHLAQLRTLPPEDWAQLKAATQRALNRILAQGLPQGLPPQMLQRAIALQFEGELPPEQQKLGQALLEPLLRNQVTLVVDPVRSRFLADLRVRTLEPVTISLEPGQELVRAGEPISERQFVILDALQQTRRRVNLLGLLQYAALVSAAIAAFLLTARRWRPGLRLRDHLLLLLLTLSVPIGLGLPFHLSTLPAVGLLAGCFYGPMVGSVLVGLLTALMPLGLPLQVGLELTGFLASAIAALVAALQAGRLRAREELAVLGLAVGAADGLAQLLLSLVIGPGLSDGLAGLLLSSLEVALLGLACSVVALGLSPYLERLFDLVTPIRLAELSNPNRPMLQRLARESPGTFQHTLFVATLAESAARALGCNVELVRAGTLYHDLGKMYDPQSFIENQRGGPNKHEQIADPWVSAEIIKRHVSEGLVMARRCGLPRAVRDFIPEHQGTMLIGYFYQQARTLAESGVAPRAVVEAEFRYDGPRPRSRETGIVMLADSCEAALRSLRDASSTDALNMVKRIIRARWQDHQLDESGLTRSDLIVIAQVFVQIWEQFHHKRIAYPSAR